MHTNSKTERSIQMGDDDAREGTSEISRLWDKREIGIAAMIQEAHVHTAIEHYPLPIYRHHHAALPNLLAGPCSTHFGSVPLLSFTCTFCRTQCGYNQRGQTSLLYSPKTKQSIAIFLNVQLLRRWNEFRALLVLPFSLLSLEGNNLQLARFYFVLRALVHFSITAEMRNMKMNL